MIEVLLFIAIFTYGGNWMQFNLLTTKIWKPRAHFTHFHNEPLLSNIEKKVGLRFKIHVQNSDRIFGFMLGLPFNPTMIVSQGAVTHLDDNGLEWLILHEAGHCIHWHNLKSYVLFALLTLGGVWVISNWQLGVMGSVIVGFIDILVWNQLRRLLEFQADAFALSKLTEAQGMVSANQTMKEKAKSIFYNNFLLHLLFTPHLTYDRRIAMARRKLLLN